MHFPVSGNQARACVCVCVHCHRALRLSVKRVWRVRQRRLRGRRGHRWLTSPPTARACAASGVRTGATGPRRARPPRGRCSRGTFLRLCAPLHLTSSLQAGGTNAPSAWHVTALRHMAPPQGLVCVWSGPRVSASHTIPTWAVSKRRPVRQGAAAPGGRSRPPARPPAEVPTKPRTALQRAVSKASHIGPARASAGRARAPRVRL